MGQKQLKDTDPEKYAVICRMLGDGTAKAVIAAKAGVNRGTVTTIAKRLQAEGKANRTRQATPASTNLASQFLPDPAPEAGGPTLPEPEPLSYDAFDVDTTGTWLVISDLHIPYHDTQTICRAFEEARSMGAVGVLLNGDILDCYQLSRHYKEPDKGRFKDSIEKGRQFLAWARSQLPRGRIVFKEGNHDERLRHYLAERAPDLFDLPDMDLRNLLRGDDKGIEWVADKRIINLGRLPVVHGHEFRGGGGVNPARWLFLRSVSTAMCGHFHRTSEHHEQGLDRRLHGVWSVGCACYLFPAYDPNNKWNHGYALVDVARDGFRVTNRRILRDGRVV